MRIDATGRVLYEVPPRFREGVVTIVSPLTVAIADGTVECSRLAAYTPALNDRVLVLFSLGAGTVIGRVIP